MKKQIAFLCGMMAVLMIVNAPHYVMAHGKDITVSGKVTSVADENAGKTVMSITDDKSGKTYILKPEHKKGTLPESIKEGATVSVSGDEISKDGKLYLKVEKVK